MARANELMGEKKEEVEFLMNDDGLMQGCRDASFGTLAASLQVKLGMRRKLISHCYIELLQWETYENLRMIHFCEDDDVFDEDARDHRRNGGVECKKKEQQQRKGLSVRQCQVELSPRPSMWSLTPPGHHASCHKQWTAPSRTIYRKIYTYF